MWDQCVAEMSINYLYKEYIRFAVNLFTISFMVNRRKEKRGDVQLWMEILNNSAEINPLETGQMLESVVGRR